MTTAAQQQVHGAHPAHTPENAPLKANTAHSGQVKKKGGALNMLSENMHDMSKNYFAVVTNDPLSSAFTRKVSVHAGMSGGMVEKDKQQETLAKLRTKPRSGQAAAYVHLPYCESKCIYCGFFGGKYTMEKGADYLSLLLREIEAEQKYHVGTTPINALYLGGGTPTALQASELEHLLTTLRSALPLANDCEITVEGRVFNFGQEKMEACLKGGANRFSLGVQSFNTEIRRRLGRIEPRENIIKSITQLASYNQAAIVVDLIYGLPGQTLQQWEDDLNTFLDLPLDGVDLYQLNIFPGNALHDAIERGSMPPVAPLAEQGQFFERGVQTMQNARMHRRSMSHWAKNNRERNTYNPLAKKKADCLNFGAGAGGLLHGHFMFNHNKMEKYTEAVSAGNKPLAMLALPPKDFAPIALILEQMECCKLNLDTLTAAMATEAGTPYANKNAQTFYAPLLLNWQEAGLITLDGPWLELTLAGQFWQVNLTQALIGWLRSGEEPQTK